MTENEVDTDNDKSSANLELLILDTVIPEISDADIHEEIDVSSVQKLDLLVNQLLSATRFIDNKDKSKPFDSKLKLIPNINILRVLVTLATRIPQINWVDDGGTIDIVKLGNDKEVQRDATNLALLRARSMNWLVLYMSRLSKMNIEQKEKIYIYKSFLPLMEDFIVLPEFIGSKTTERAASKNARKDITSIFKKPNNIILMLENSPKKKNIQKLPISPHVVADSEEEPTLLMQPRNLDEDLQHVYDKYLPSKKHKKNKSPGSLEESIDFLSKNPNSRKASPSPILESKPDDEINLKLFGDNLLSWKLNPSFNKGYCMWSLIEWAFYCADKSSAEPLSLGNIDYHSCLYRNYRDFIKFVFEFVDFDFAYFLKTRLCPIFNCKKQELRYHIYKAKTEYSNSKATLVKKAFDDHKFLISKLLLQRSHKPIYWYDRVVESIFYGLDFANDTTRPLFCYQKENQLTLKPPKRLAQTMNPNVADSLHLRYQILYSVYYYSLYQSDLTPDTHFPDIEESFVSESPLSTYNLMKLASAKLSSVNVVAVDRFISLCLLKGTEDYKYLTRLQFFILLMSLILEEVADFKLLFDMIAALGNTVTTANYGALYAKVAEIFSSTALYASFDLNILKFDEPNNAHNHEYYDGDVDDQVRKVIKNWCISRRVIFSVAFFSFQITHWGKRTTRSKRSKRVQPDLATEKDSFRTIHNYICTVDSKMLKFLHKHKNSNWDWSPFEALLQKPMDMSIMENIK